MWVYIAWCQWWLYLERWLLCSNPIFLHVIPFLMRIRFGHVPGTRMTFFSCWRLSVFQFSSGEYLDHCYYILAFVILICTILCPAMPPTHPEPGFTLPSIPPTTGSNREVFPIHKFCPVWPRHFSLIVVRRQGDMFPTSQQVWNSHKLHWGRALLYDWTEKSSDLIGCSTLSEWGQESWTLKKATLPDPSELRVSEIFVLFPN